MKRRVGVFVCECGTNKASVVDTEKVAAAAKNMPGVIFATNYKYMCSDPGQDLIKNAIKEHNNLRNKSGRSILRRQLIKLAIKY